MDSIKLDDVLVDYEQLLKTADALARDLTQQKVDPNEIASALTTLRGDLNGPRFFKYLDMVISNGDAVVRSNRTLGYYRKIRRACQDHLRPYEDQPETMAYILGWTIRLMRFYRAEGLSPNRPSRSGKQRSTSASSVPAAGGRLSGRVKFYNSNRGFGFIIPDGGGKDIFVHKSKLAGGVDALSDGQRVTYEVDQGRKGPEARNVRVE